MMPTEEREAALELFCETLALAAVAEGTTSVIRLLAWVEARSEDDGGFLWLSGILGYRPQKMADMIRSTIESTPRQRKSLTKRLLGVHTVL